MGGEHFCSRAPSALFATVEYTACFQSEKSAAELFVK